MGQTLMAKVSRRQLFAFLAAAPLAGPVLAEAANIERREPTVISPAPELIGVPRLVAFRSPWGENYALVFSDHTMHVVEDGAYTIDAAGSFYSITTPYKSKDLRWLRFEQVEIGLIIRPLLSRTEVIDILIWGGRASCWELSLGKTTFGDGINRAQLQGSKYEAKA